MKRAFFGKVFRKVNRAFFRALFRAVAAAVSAGVAAALWAGAAGSGTKGTKGTVGPRDFAARFCAFLRNLCQPRVCEGTIENREWG